MNAYFFCSLHLEDILILMTIGLSEPNENTDNESEGGSENYRLVERHFNSLNQSLSMSRFGVSGIGKDDEIKANILLAMQGSTYGEAISILKVCIQEVERLQNSVVLAFEPFH